jgi:hypothetical protein
VCVVVKFIVCYGLKKKKVGLAPPQRKKKKNRGLGVRKSKKKIGGLGVPQPFF